jgi:hypothetical protein
LNNEEVLGRIIECITHIETKYKFDQGKQELRFDAVVVTHWDQDHWGGVRQLMKDGCKKAFKDLKVLETLVKESTNNVDKIALLEQDVSGLQCRYFKYSIPTKDSIFRKAGDPKKATPPTRRPRSELLTTFYCPYLVGPQERGDKPIRKTLKDGDRVAPKSTDYTKNEERIKSKMSGPFFIQNGCGDFTLLQGKNTLGARICFDYDISEGGMVTEKGKLFRFFDLCKLVCEYDEYLGAELFTGTTFPAEHTTFKDPSLLIKAFAMANKGFKKEDGPRMFIVAGDQVIVGATALAKAAPFPVTTVRKLVKRPGGVVHVVDTRDKHLGEGKRQTTARFGSKPMNSPSLVCLILSATLDASTIPDSGNPKAWKLWHYMVGHTLSSTGSSRPGT